MQPSSTKSSLTLDSEYDSHMPQHIKSDKASIWLYHSLETHSLSQKLSWLLTDKAHLQSCYQEQAFLCQEKYAESVLICLRAVERNQPGLMSEIDPCLFLSKTNIKVYHKSHRRCSSFPDNHFKTTGDFYGNFRSKTLHKLDLHCKEVDNTKCSPKIINKRIHGKLKPWNSLPNLAVEVSTIRERSKSVAHSRTTPSTPVLTRYPKNNVFSTATFPTPLKTNIKKCRKTSSNITKRVKHVVINNNDIIEHTPPLNHLCNSSALTDELVNLSIKSLPETKSPIRKINVSRSAPDYSFLTALSGEKDYKRKPKKTFIEDGGMSILPMATG